MERVALEAAARRRRKHSGHGGGGDLLHPNAKGYQLWYDAMQPTLDEMLK